MEQLIIYRGSQTPQRGAAIVMALVILLVITFASLAMIASMRAGISTAGNIAFRQAAVRVADVGIRVAFDRIKTLLADPNALNSDLPTEGYWATHNGATGCQKAGVVEFSPIAYDFTNPNCARLASSAAGYNVYYVIHRMAGAGGCPGDCAMTPMEERDCVSRGGTDPCLITTTIQYRYYRVTVKVVGPRNNNRFVQTYIY